MFIVPVDGKYQMVASMSECASRAQSRLRFLPASEAPDLDDGPRVWLTDTPLGAPYEVGADRSIRVSSRDSDRISRYARSEEGAYLLLCAMLALPQWRALSECGQMIPEDFIHPEGSDCLFSRCADGGFPLLLDEPTVCPECVQFYLALGAEQEVVELLNVVRFAAEEKSDV